MERAAAYTVAEDIKHEKKLVEKLVHEMKTVESRQVTEGTEGVGIVTDPKVEKVVEAVTKITDKIDRLENILDRLMIRMSRAATSSDFHSEMAQSQTRVTTHESSSTASFTYRNGTLTTLSSGTELPQPQAPLFVERFEEQKVREKGTVRLVAKVVGNPIPSVTWFRNNKLLLASPRITEMFDGEQIVLEIVDADSEEDAGDYKCVATNTVGTATHGARLTVDVEKVFFTKLLPRAVEVDETESTVLECETSHTVSTTWYHNGKELSGMDHREIIQEGRRQRLVIKKAIPRDSGEYTCSVKDQKTSTTLKVHDVKPFFVKKLEDFEVKEQECAILEVEISSDTADVVWEKDGMEVEPEEGRVILEKTGNVRKLLIRSTSVHDEGEYICRLTDQECSAEVTVIELPPEILTKMQDTTVTRGEKASFEVELTKGDALVRWFKDDVELQFSEHVQLSIDGKRQKLKIYQAEDSDAGVYSCRVGDQMSTATLTVEEPKVEFITRLPDVTMLSVGADAEFLVELSRPDVDVKWLKKGKEVKPSGRVEITVDGAVRKMVIKKVTTEDQSDYTCIAMNVKTSTKLKIEIIETGPKIAPGPREYRVKKGEDVTFQINFSATPQPTEEWTVNGNVVKTTKRITTKFEEGFASLTIKKVEESDVGNYTLKLRNNVGEASAELTLIIIEVPGAPNAPDIVETTESSVTVHWKPPENDGNSPITSYVLEHHDKEEFMTWHKITDIVETTHKVTKLKTNSEVMFRVSAVNSVGQGPCSGSTKFVRVSSPRGNVAPTLQQPLQDLTVGLGSPATLSCVIGGVPTPEIKWLKDKKVVKIKTISFSSNIAKLTIESCVESSAGKYTCKATNTAGTVETSCTLKVQDAPTLKIDEEMLNQSLRVTSQWKPVVEFRGHPKPEIAWTKDGKPIVEDKKAKIYTDESTTTIAIYSVERRDTGAYQVAATNTAGTASLTLNLRVIDDTRRKSVSPFVQIRDKPSKPKKLFVMDVDTDSVTVGWEPPLDDGGVEISKYSLEKCEVTKMIWTKVADVERDARTYTIHRLITDAEYMFRIFAQNPVGISEARESEKVIVKVKFDKPSEPIGPLGVSGVTETSCTISWEPPLSDGGSPIIDYSIEWKEVEKTSWTKLGVSHETQFVVSEMKKDTAYDFRIAARNKVGTGPPYCTEEPVVAGRKKRSLRTIKQNAIFVLLGSYPARRYSGLPTPSPPLNLTVVNIASKSVKLQWNPPQSTGGSELTGYVIEKQPITSSKWTKVATLDPAVTSFTVENLKEKSEFYFRVFAENAVGLSYPATTSLVSLKTHATVPSPPTAPLEVRSTSSNSVVVEWGVPESDGGAPIEGYKIAVRDMKRTMWMEVGQVKADVQKLTIKDLQENHEYLIRIFARNEVGLSEPLESDEPFKVQRPGIEMELSAL